MKRRDLIKQLATIAKTKGKTLTLTEGGNHTKAKIGNWAEAILRHTEISEQLAKSIIRRASK